MAYASTNPFTNEVVKTFPSATDAEVDAALDRAQAAFPAWRDTPLAERAAIFHRAADLMRDRADELGKLATLEMGKLLAEGVTEAKKTVPAIIDWLADTADEALRPDVRGQNAQGNGGAVVTYAAEGIVFSIEPWNVPFYQAVRGFAPAAIAGNVVLLKHASIVPQCAQAIVDLFHEAGLPEGVWQNLYATHEQADRIIADPRIRAVTLTGSDTAGRHVAARAGQAARRTVLELGGQDAFIVLDDAEPAAAAQAGVGGRCFNGGQICISPKRMIVLDSVADEFEATLRATADAYTVPGDPMDPATTLAPMSSQSQADTVKEQIARAVAAGATATELGGAVPDTGAFVPFTLLTGVTADNPLFHEEIFGPVIMLFRVPDEAAAIDLANDSPFGLSGSVWSTDPAHAFAVACKVDSGQLGINMPIGSGGPAIPFGGVKDSGYGIELGIEGIRGFCNIKPVDIPADYRAEVSSDGAVSVVPAP